MKQSAIDMLTETIRTVHQAKIGLGEYIDRGRIDPQSKDRGPAIQAWRFWSRLTSREREIFLLSLRGYRNKDIAGKLSISAETVRIHLHHIYVKLRVSDRQ